MKTSKETPYVDEDDYHIGTCERCKKKTTKGDDVRFMGYSLFLCPSCGIAAIRNGEAVD